MLDNARKVIEELKSVIAEAKMSAPSEILLQKQALLRETTAMIARLEQKNLPVPEAYRAEKAQLLSDLSRMEGAIKTLDYVADELDDILSNLGFHTYSKLREPVNKRSRVDDFAQGDRSRHTHGQRPTAFQVDDSPLISVKTWRGVLIEACEYLIAKYPEKVREFTRLSGSKRRFFEETPDKFVTPYKLSCGLYVELNRSKESIMAFVYAMLERCGAPPTALRIKTSKFE